MTTAETWFAWCFSHGHHHQFTPCTEYPDGAWCTAFWTRLAGATQEEALADKRARYGDARFEDQLPLETRVDLIDERWDRRG